MTKLLDKANQRCVEILQAAERKSMEVGDGKDHLILTSTSGRKINTKDAVKNTSDNVSKEVDRALVQHNCNIRLATNWKVLELVDSPLVDLW